MVKSDLVCPHCKQFVSRVAEKCPFCGTILHQSEISETLPDPVHFDMAFINDHAAKNQINLQPHEVALYIEDASIPLVLDISNRITLGRQSARDTRVTPTVSLNSYDAFNRGLSRVHATLYYDTERGEAMLVDEYSTNGTWLNGERLAPMTPTPVHNGDEVRLSRLNILLVTPTKQVVENHSGYEID